LNSDSEIKRGQEGERERERERERETFDGTLSPPAILDEAG